MDMNVWNSYDLYRHARFSVHSIAPQGPARFSVLSIAPQGPARFIVHSIAPQGPVMELT